MAVIAIDPGNVLSAWLIYDGTKPLSFGKWDNRSLLRAIKVGPELSADECAIETLKPRGMPTSFEEMQTQLWAGRFIEAWFEHRAGGEKFAVTEPHQMFRHDIKMHICGHATAKDKNIRAALIDRFGGESVAIGGKKCPRCKGKGWIGRDHEPCAEWLHPPGPLFGIADDCWSALAIAVTFTEQRAIKAA